MKIELKVGGEFNWFGGSLTGRFLEIDPPSGLKMTWRFSQWPKGTESRVSLQFEEVGNSLGTLIRLYVYRRL